MIKLSAITQRVSFVGKKNIIVALIVSVVVLGGYGIYKSFQLTDAERAQKELAVAMSSVSKHMILPKDDEPVLATVTDAEALIKQQAFFTGAVNGDQLLLFPRSLKAVIYSPSRERIINAGPIEQQSQATASQTNADLTQKNAESPRESATVSNALTVEVRNGTGKSGLAARMAKSIRAAGYEVIAVADAKNKNYPKTILATNTNDNAKSELAASLAFQIGAEFATELPDREKATDADALIIIGRE